MNLKWILYEITGWIFVILVISFSVTSIILRSNKFLLGTRFSGAFIVIFAKLIRRTTMYMEYGDRTGLQQISDKFYKNMLTTLL